MFDFWDDSAPPIIALVIFALCTCGFLAMDKAGCDAKTADIGFDNRWSVFGGCQIEVVEGQWIPLDSYYFKQE